MIRFELRHSIDYSYSLDIETKFTLVRDKSATGKSTLINHIGEYLAGSRFISVKCELPVYVLDNLESDYSVLSGILNAHADYLVFIDEDAHLFKLKSFTKLLFDIPCVFVIICREKKFHNLPIHRDSIKVLDSTEHILKSKYTQRQMNGIPRVILTEDSASSCQFLSNIFKGTKVMNCGEVLRKKSSGVAALGASLRKLYKQDVKDIAVAYDKSAIGEMYDGIIEICTKFPDLNLWELDWESFEWYLLHLKFIYHNIHRWIKTSFTDCISIERYATDLLKLIVNKKSHSLYNKSKLCECFTLSGCADCSNNMKCQLSHRSGQLIDHEVLELYKRIPPQEVIEWCRSNSSPAFQSLSDSELLEYMLPTYLEHLE